MVRDVDGTVVRTEEGRIREAGENPVGEVEERGNERMRECSPEPVLHFLLSSLKLPPDTVTAVLQSLDPTDDGETPVSSGKLLLTSGPDRGKVVKFHRFKCVAFGRSLATADLAYIFHHEEKVRSTNHFSPIEVENFSIQVVVKVSDGEAVHVVVGPPSLSESDPDPALMSIRERLDFITWQVNFFHFFYRVARVVINVQALLFLFWP